MKRATRGAAIRHAVQVGIDQGPCLSTGGTEQQGSCGTVSVHEHRDMFEDQEDHCSTNQSSKAVTREPGG